MGKGWEGIAASSGENNPFGSCEAFTKNFGRRQEEDRGSRTRSLGEVQSGEEESCLEPVKPAARCRQFRRCSRLDHQVERWHYRGQGIMDVALWGDLKSRVWSGVSISSCVHSRHVHTIRSGVN